MSVEGASFDHDYFPLSAAQTNIYFAQKLAPEVPFTIAQYVELCGPVEPATLIRATDIACRDLQSPGVRLAEIDGQPVQFFDVDVPYAMIHRDLRDEDDPVGEAMKYMDEQYRQPVDLARDQLIVSEIIQVADEHYFWFSRAHHVVMDGLGAISLQERTAAAYTALVTGTELAPTRAASVREISDYDAAYPHSSRYETDRAYWLGRLDGHTDSPRLARSTAVPSGISISVGAALDADLAAAIAEFATNYNSSDVPVVLAAFSLYLARMTDTDDVMLSLPVSGRATTKLRASSGMMSNIVPLRIGVDASVTVHELLRRIQVELTGALRHQRFRVEDMRRAAGDQPNRLGSFGPTVNIMMYDSTIRLGDVVGEYRVLSSGPIDDLMVNVYPGVAGSSTRVDFLGNPAVYSTEELSVHHAGFLNVLRALVAAPDRMAVGDVAVGDVAVGDTSVVDGAVSVAAVDTGTVAPQLLPALLRDGITLVADDIEHSTADVVEGVEHVAALLIASGAGPEVRIASAVPRSAHSVLTFAAIAASGASYVPIDPAEPAERLAGMLVDAGVTVGIAARATLAALPDVVEWFALEDLLESESLDYRPPVLHLDNEAYLIHTSGSTGQPKAVSVTHHGLAQLAANVVERYGMTSESRVLHAASPVFDASLQEILAACAARATLVVAPADVFAGPALADIVIAERITHLITSPTVLATLDPSVLDGVETFDVGGEECPPSLRDRFAGHGAVMLNAYGPTETTVLATVSEPMVRGEKITIGAALPGVRAVVLDKQLRPSPRGGVGELYLGGDGLARGYTHASATAARFVADPAVPGERLYRTGDVVRWTVDGAALEFLGRRDRQVQLHGRRLELGEIEAVASDTPGVVAAAAVLREDRVVLYVTGDDRGLDGHLRERLAPWAVPSRVVWLDVMPVTAGGKLDRRALPTPAEPSASKYVAPQTDTETLVAGVFAEVLEAGDVGREHTFFELGGDSLSATRVVARLGAGVTLQMLFDAPDVAGLAAAIDAAEPSETSLELVDIVLPERIPLSYAQQRMWFLNQFDSQSPAYNMPVAVRLSDGTDPGIVIAALRDVLERHESLRTYFPDDGDGPRQVIRPTGSVVGVNSMFEIPTREVTEDDVDDAIAEFASTGFDVAADVPLRAVVLRVGDATVLVMVLHHIAIDGWSVDPLIHDFTVAHAARTAGHAPTWPRLPVQYSHYAVWNRAVVDAAADDQLAYWAGLFDRTSTGGSWGALAGLPTDRPRPAVQSMKTASAPITVDPAVSARIREIARAAHATTFMVVHAALAVALTRFGESDATVIGTPSAGRGHEALDEMVGMFVGTVPLAVEVDASSTFSDVLEAVRRADLDAFAHAEVPFERIVGAVAGDRSLDRHPLFQVMLAFDTVAHRPVDDLPLSVLAIDTHTSEFDLTLVLAETESGIGGQVEYAVDLYERGTVDLFVAVFSEVLRAATDNLAVVVGDIALGDIALGDTALGDTPLSAPFLAPTTGPEGTLLDVLTAGLGAAESAIAVDGATQLTYGELDRRSNRLARLLIANGVGPEVLVAVSLERSADYVLAVWAIVKSGGAFVPVDPVYPTARREHMMRGIRIGIGNHEVGVQWLAEADALTYSDAPITDADRTAALGPAHPAYVIHTSGSTGVPKPVTITHAGVHALAQQVVGAYAVSSESRVLHGYSVNFDAAVLELVLAFGAGATMVIAPTDLVDGDAIAHFLTEYAVTHYLSTPAVLSTVPPTPGVTTVAVGGDVLGSGVVDAWSPGRRMLNAYGPSETTVVATLHDSLTPGAAVTIGRPLAHVSAVVLDRRLKPVPVGGVGELYLGGAGLARGYGGHAALTAERFVAAPGGSRLYRTGDMVRVDATGAFDFRGRLDSQVQIRGVRVELGDIEMALRAHPDVTGAVATVRGDTIVAWVVGIGEQEAKRWLLDRLPLPMMPAVVTPIDRIPLTGNGKIDLAALRTTAVWTTAVGTTAVGTAAVGTAGLGAPAPSDAVGPSSMAADVVLGIFADVLGISEPGGVSGAGSVSGAGVDTNFFVLGGDSLSAARAVTRIGAALGTRVPVRTLFEAPTARLLAAAVETLSEEYTPLPALTHRRAAREHTGLAPAERRIWVQNRYEPTSAAYNIAFELPLPDDLDISVVRAAIADVLERHLPLRTVYPSTSAGPVTALLDADTVVSSLDDRHADATSSATDGFDLTIEPPVRFAVTRTADGPVLTVVAHHIAVDGLSLAPLARDVETALTARFVGAAPEFVPLAVDYADYRLWQQHVLDAVADGQLDYWRRTLAGIPDYLDLPTGTGDSSDDPVEFAVDADVLAGLRTLAHSHGATVFVVVHAALAAALAEASGTRDIAIGSPVSGRSAPALDDLVGMFVGTVALRTDVDPSKTFAEFVVDVRNRDLDAFAHADVPFEWVVEAVRPERSVDTHPLFQVLLAFGQLDTPTFHVGTEVLSPRRIDISPTQFDLEVVVEESSDGLVGRIGYSSARFGRSVPANLAQRLTEILESVATRPDVALGSVEFLRPGGGIVVEREGVAEQLTLGEFFDAAARQWPDNIAVVDGTTTLTYAELDRRAHVLAHRLVRAGAAPGTLVAVALPRSADFVTAVWAVAKTGSGYLPIDPTQPPARIADILEHAKPVTGISSETFGSREDSWTTITDEPYLVTSADQVPVRRAPVGDTAYVIYTSGSTGAPKGVRVTHRGIADLVRAQRDLFRVTPESAVLQFASPSFDAYVFELLLAFGVGATSVIVPPSIYAGRELEAFIDRHHITHVCLTPTVLQITDPDATPSVGTVVMAGEAVNSELLQRWSRGRSVFNAYGPTETTIMSTCTGTRTTAGRSVTGPVTIGEPVSGFRAVVLDGRLRPVGEGVVGELYLGGDALADGYLGQSALTATRFVPDMLGSPGARLYRTGDLVRWIGGELEYLGRVDSQVKIRGHRVELFDVEAALLRHPSVAQACVVGHGDSLAAYVVGDVDPRDVRGFLTRSVPSYMVPGTVTVVDALPMTLARKVDVSMLPAPAALSMIRRAPSTDLERVVHAAFADVLRVPAEQVGVDDDFFDLGGHSLSVVQVMDALGAELGRRIPVTLLLGHPTAAALAAHLDGAAGETDVFDVLLPIRGEGTGLPVFCVHPAIGIAWSYLSLLGETDRPLYGLQVPGIADGALPPSSIEDFAARYVDEIRAVQPEGPYHLLGWSLGGVIAHALAVRLQAEGEEIALLAIVDAQLEPPAGGAEFGVADLAEHLGVSGTSFENIAEELARTRSELAFLTPDHLRRMYHPVAEAPRWVSAYRPQVFKGDAVYFAARGSDGVERWKDFVDGRLSVRRIDVEHDDMLGETGARALGRVLGTDSVTEGVA